MDVSLPAGATEIVLATRRGHVRDWEGVEAYLARLLFSACGRLLVY